MADTVVKSSDAQRAYRVWMTSFVVVSALMVGVGLLLAGGEPGVARAWTGLGFVVAMWLAIVVGLSKTSSA